ncbi:hypothetical protein W03_24370 [Nitrosomonas sp. PY1]|uniref:YbaY family lipoprotein n=1 Tax=Nitrosomonas sp. PY1 TaxID=1803906 RepID=UPI001FC8B666|nr:META domain-containing protein [Nitrosomonas sp. PY1]GKS70433.1 hypothetical protein W03_24370 [Nitrosomonas sp. PY1]
MAWAGTLSGTAIYRERIALPAGAVFEAELQDVSRADAPATVLGRSQLIPVGRLPIRFEINYDDTTLQSDHRYIVRATIRHQDRLLFTTDKAYPVLNDRNTSLQLLLVSVRSSSPPESKTNDIGALPASYEGELPGAGNPILWHVNLLPEGRYQLRITHIGQPEPNRFDDIGRWVYDESGRIVLRSGRETPIFLMPVEDGTALRKLDLLGKLIESNHNDRLLRSSESKLIEPQLILTGMFDYMANAATITLCADGQRLPVAMEGDYEALEAAYQRASLQPGQALLVNLDGTIKQRPSMGESYPVQAILIVDRFITTWPRETCGNTLADSPLRGTYWKLVRLNDNPVAISAKQRREAQLVFATDTLRVSGNTGCNRINGSFEINNDKLRFSRMASTKMACLEGMDLEERFLSALKHVERYRIIGSHLELLDATGTISARFEATVL